MHWLEEALQAGLQALDSPELLRAALEHAGQEDPFRDSRAEKRISPTLIAEECRLARLKRFRHHSPQPGWKWRAVKAGRPSAGSNMHTFRGTIAEGMAVAALRAVAGDFGVEILGVSPTAVYECSVILGGPGDSFEQTANFLAYPDMILLHEGQAELVQMKCPSVHAFARYRRDGPGSLRRRYQPQAICEMYVGRKMGMPLVRNHILAFAFEGELPGSEYAKAGREVLSLVDTVEWEPGHDRFIESIAQEILEDDAAAERGEWPVAYPVGTKWPCDYCNWPRTASDESTATCEEVEKWGEPSSRSSTSGSPASPSPSPPPLPAPTTSAGSSGRRRLTPTPAGPPEEWAKDIGRTGPPRSSPPPLPASPSSPPGSRPMAPPSLPR